MPPGGRPPAVGQISVEGQGVPGGRQGDEISPGVNPFAGLGAGERPGMERDLARRSYDDGQGVGEIRIPQELPHVFDVAGQPQVVIGQVADDVAVRFPQGFMTVDLTVSWSFGVIEESDP